MILINSSPKDTLKIFQPFLPIYVPVGSGFLMAECEKQGIDIKFLDEQVENNIYGLIEEYVKEMKPPYIFGFSILTQGFRGAVAMSERLKGLYPDSKVIFGGVHPSALPEESLAYPFVDVVVRGEGEFVLPELYGRIKNRENYSDLQNVSYKENGQFVHNELGPILKDLDGLPRFPYHRFNPKHYDMGFVLTSRGCPHKCTFCSNRVTTGLSYRFRTAQAIVDDLELLYEKYGKHRICVVDDNFTVNKKRLYDLTKEIKRRGYHKKLTFFVQGRGDNVDEELLTELYSAGFNTIFFGLETASERIMKSLKKGETVEDNSRAVKIAKKVGFNVRGAYIFGLPGDTHQDRMDCIRQSKELGLDWVRYNNATPYPGTELYEIAKREGSLGITGLYENFVSVGPFIENPLKPISLSYIPEGNTEKEIKDDIMLGYLRDYLNLPKILSILKRKDLAWEEFNPGEQALDIIKKLPAIVTLGFWLSIKFGSLIFGLLFKQKKSQLRTEYAKIYFGSETKNAN
jgi:anaerobic magnesium-protoporphyrin IX monomethyl ester cyclase